jgi:hypothetical protein
MRKKVETFRRRNLLGDAGTELRIILKRIFKNGL